MSSKGAGKGATTTPKSTDMNGPSRSQVVKDGWGSRMNFQASYGLKPGNDEDWQEGNRILDAMMEADLEKQQEQAAQQSQQHDGHQQK